MIDLLPCPFCGHKVKESKAVKLIDVKHNIWTVSCDGCEASVIDDTRKSVIETWSRRYEQS